MKFKIEPKDFMMFIIYCSVLLYLSALAVANVFSLINENTFSGFFPISAFSSKYIGFTLTVFIGFLIVIFSSVSSYIFDKDKGKGIGLNIKEKSSDGYARWATEKEIKEGSNVVKILASEKTLNAAGIPLINNGKEIWVDNGSYHNLVIGSTGSGKTENLVFPMVNILAKKGESMIITDPKGEIYRKTAENLKDRGYKIIILNFREPNKGNSWNPLALPYQYYKTGNIDKATELLEDISLNILYDPNNKSDSDFWEKGAADYFSGLALGLFQDAMEKEVNLNSINYMSNVGEERYGATNYIKEYFNMKGKDSNAYMFANTVINAPSDTKGGLLSTFSQKIRMFSTKENLSEMLSYSDFDMRDIGKEKTAVFMIIHDEKKTYHSLMTIFIKQCYETLIDVAQSSPGGKLQFRTNFILDEFANMPPLKDVDSMVSAARSRDIRFTFIIQNFAQLNDIYGENVEEISKMCGEVKSKDKDKTASTPLITISDLQKLKLGDAIIIRLRTSPFKTKYTPNFKINWGEEYPEATYPERQMNKIQLFDLKKFVTEEKGKNMMNNGMGNMNNMGMPGGFNPFGDIPSMNNPFMNMNSNPFNMGNKMNPMADRNLFDNPKKDNNPFASDLKDLDIDAMMKDIDRKLQELDEEEKRQKEKLREQNRELMNNANAETNSLINKIKDIDKEPVLDDEDEDSEFEPIKPIEDTTNKDSKDPKVNVDVNSVIVNENVITDDEFFDDFFSD